MDKQLLTTTQLAKLLGTSRITVWQKIKKGQIMAVRVGRNYVIDKALLPQLFGHELSQQQKKDISQAIKGTVSEYGETLKLLGKE